MKTLIITQQILEKNSHVLQGKSIGDIIIFTESNFPRVWNNANVNYNSNLEEFYNVIKPALQENEKHLPLESKDFNAETKEATHRIAQIPQPIAEELQQLALQKETQMYIQRTQDGINSYAEISAEFRLAKLSGELSEETHRAIELALIPTRNEILAGQWISGLQLLEELGSSTIGLELYNRLHLMISNYISNNYE